MSPLSLYRPFSLFAFRAVALAAFGLLLPRIAAAEDAAVQYSVSLEDREHHEATITATFTDLGAEPLELRMSRTSPGRYRMHEFAKNIYSISAMDGLGEALELEPVTLSHWRVDGHDGTVQVKYTLFGDLLSGTYSSIDARRAVLNPPASFVWAEGLELRPIQVQFDLPLGWDVVSQLIEVAPSRFEAPDLGYFLDSPIGLGTFDSRTWRVDPAGRPVPLTPESLVASEAENEVSGDGPEQSIRLAVHHPGETALVDRYQDSVVKLVAEAGAVFGALPEFDFGRYTFIANYLPFAHDDAMEHRNSTVHSSPDSFERSQERLLHTLIHEFFHIWNVERIRPDSLEPFDFSELNPSAELWFAEGFTNYYDGLLMVRSGIHSEAQFLSDLTVTVDRFLNSPARRVGGAAYMSWQAPFNDRAVWVDPRNAVNTYLHYYYYGEALGLALDLGLRRDFDSSLDLFMQRVWQAHGVGGRGLEKPYTNDDLEMLLAEHTSVEFASKFFADFVHAGGAPDFSSLLETVGLTLVSEGEAEPWLGFAGLSSDAQGVFVQGPTRVGSPLYAAGLGKGDRILELGDRELENMQDVERALRRKQPGDVVRLVSERRNEWQESSLTLGRDPSVKVVLAQERTGAVDAARQRWLASQVQAEGQADEALAAESDMPGQEESESGAENAQASEGDAGRDLLLDRR